MKFQKIEYPELGITINAALNMPEDHIINNIRVNSKRGLPQVWPCKEQDTELAICAGGPSLKWTLEDVRKVQESGGKVVALANSAKLLMENGIKPNAHVFLDSRPGNIKFIIPDLECTYLVASQCDPEIFDRLEGKNVHIWHAINNPEECDAIGESYESWVPVQGGNTIALRSLRMFQILGYHKFHLFGLDSCNIDGEHHAYEQPSADELEEAVIGLNGHEFRCTAWQIQQAMEFMKMVKVFGQEWEVAVYGDGLISTMVKEGGKNGSDSV